MVGVCALVTQGGRRLVRGRAHGLDQHGLDAAARHRRRGGAARRSRSKRRADRRGAEQAAEGTDPPGDLNATADYKRHLARVLCRRALERAAEAHRPEESVAGGRHASDRLVEASARRWPASGYLADRALATAVFLAATLEQPLLLEGEAGVGKTEVAKALAGATGARLIRLQCHEGIDVHHALYDWDYAAPAAGPARGRGRRRRGRAVLAARSCCAGRCSRRSSTTGRWCC